MANAPRPATDQHDPVYYCGRTKSEHKSLDGWAAMRDDGASMGLLWRTCLECGSSFCIDDPDAPPFDDGEDEAAQ